MKTSSRTKEQHPYTCYNYIFNILHRNQLCHVLQSEWGKIRAAKKISDNRNKLFIRLAQFYIICLVWILCFATNAQLIGSLNSEYKEIFLVRNYRYPSFTGNTEKKQQKRGHLCMFKNTKRCWFQYTNVLYS